jgi:hypothetical protein
MNRRQFAHHDAGFTVIELVLSIFILGLIVGPLCGAIFVAMETSGYSLDHSVTRGTSQDRLVTSRDQQMTGEYFGSDVQASASFSPPPSSCTTSASRANVVIAFTWQDSSGGARNRTDYAWYYVSRPKKTDGSDDYTKLATLHRAYCSQTVAVGPASPLTISASDVTVARSVGSDPSATCYGDAHVVYPCTATSKLVVLQISLGLDSSTTFGIQAQRRMVTS